VSSVDRIRRKLQQQRNIASDPEQKSQVIDMMSAVTVPDLPLSKPEETIPSVNTNNVSEVTIETVNTNSQHEVTIESVNTNTQYEVTIESENTNSVHDGIRIVEELQQKAKARKRSTKSETHRRQTYEIRIDLIKKLDKIAKHQHRGFKGELINALLEDFIEDLMKDSPTWRKILQ
jgi:hypothetical protein